ncbi:hypothetical protein [Candidatus Nitrosotenuis cloacae]|uniref:hypothetical protein n=1 Tax=Candidatus Nitrosotenuis cloacae TaxID=1603555 RepID=UPI00227EACBB|nr:hypothetical protein [Candidatus Nitrosotenuis cloacae]
MSEIDNLLARYVENNVNSNFDKEIIIKIKKKLEKNGYSLLRAIEVFYPFEEVLRDIIGSKSSGMLERICRAVCENKPREKYAYVVKDRNFQDLILSTYGNNDKRSILQAIAKSPMSISEILDKADIPKSSGYKIVDSLLADGLLTTTDQKIKNLDGNRVSAYRPTIESIDIRINGGSIVIELQFAEEYAKKSHILKAIIKR